MTGKTIVTQNVTTFIKNSANIENIFARGGRLWGFPQSFLFHLSLLHFISASHTSVLFRPQLFIPQQQETCQDAQQRDDDADGPAQVPHAAGSEDYADQ